MALSITKKNSEEVAEKLGEQLLGDQGLMESFTEFLGKQMVESPRFRKAVDGWMDDMLDEDAWGTEGQNDPRGDHRDEG